MYYNNQRVFYFCKTSFGSYKNIALCKRVVVNGFNYTAEYEVLKKEYYSNGQSIEINNIYQISPQEEKDYVLNKLNVLNDYKVSDIKVMN